MPRRRIAALAAVGLLVPAVAFAQTESDQGSAEDPQAFFKAALLENDRTTTAVKGLLETRKGFVDPRTGFVDVTGDGKADAIVLVSIPGQAGTVALYVMTTDRGTGREDSEALRVVFSTQSLYRGTIALRDGTLVVRTPVYGNDDEPWAPSRVEERDYVWNPSSASMRRVDRRVVDGPGAD